MSALDAARDRLLAGFESAARERGEEVAWLAARRRESLAAFAEQGLPSTRHEDWRYTSLLPLAKLELRRPETSPVLSREQVEALSIPVFACSLYVFVDGRFAPELSAPESLSGGVRVESLARLLREAPEQLEGTLDRLADPKSQPFAALNTAGFEDGAALFVPPRAELLRPIHVVFVSSSGASPQLQQPRVLVVAGAESRATLIQDHVSLGEAPGLSNSLSEVWVGTNARFDLALIQREGDERFQVSGLHVRQERDSRFRAYTVSLGGRLLRNDLHALLAEEGADCELDGLFVGAGEQVLDNHTTVDHAVPHCTSRELYKGVLGGRSRGVFRGRVIVRPDAQKTNAEQSNPNLLLSDDAEIDTKPQLEIYADDVRCSHGSAIGRVDPDALFYLRARGVGEREALDLLARGFAGEVTAKIPVDALREEIDALVAAKLERASRQEAR